jgi:hypothetical protein
MAQTVTPPKIWRVEQPVRRLAALVALFFVVVAVLFTASGSFVVGTVLMWALALGIMACVWRWYLVPYVALTADHLEVQGAFAHRRVGYRSIRGVKPGTIGLQVETTKEGSVLVWAVQRSTLSGRRHQQSRADEVAAEIMARVESASASA